MIGEVHPSSVNGTLAQCPFHTFISCDLLSGKSFSDFKLYAPVNVTVSLLLSQLCLAVPRYFS